jgi:hypothetical protein
MTLREFFECVFILSLTPLGYAIGFFVLIKRKLFGGEKQ